MATGKATPKGWRSLVGAYPTLTFFLLAFLLTWPGGVLAALVSRGIVSEAEAALGVLGVLQAAGPGLAAITVAAGLEGRAGVDDLFRSIFRNGKRLSWYLVVILGQLAISGTALLLAAGGATGLDMVWGAVPLQVVGIAAAFTVWEEMGFRGIGQREMQRRFHPLLATMVVGLVWALWHLPLMATVDNPSAAITPVLFLLELLAAAIIYAWLFNRTDRSLLFVTLFHALGNVFGSIVLDNGIDLGRYVAFRLPLLWLAAIMLIVTTRGRLAAVPSGDPAASQTG